MNGKITAIYYNLVSTKRSNIKLSKLEGQGKHQIFSLICGIQNSMSREWKISKEAKLLIIDYINKNSKEEENY